MPQMLERNTKKIIVVLGMHRSGTSVVTRALQVMGVNLGDNLMQAQLGVNDKGFWEDLDIVNLNEEILKYLSNSWHYLRVISTDDVEKLTKQGFLQRAEDILQHKTSVNFPYGLKDPRLPRLLPFWQKVFKNLKLDIYYVITLRHPLSVAHSLERRDGFSLEKGILMWVDHVVASLYFTKREQRIIISYDLLMSNPDFVITSMASALNLEINQQTLKEYKEDFLDLNLKHTNFKQKDLNESFVPKIARDIYQELTNAQTDRVFFNSYNFETVVTKWHNFVSSQSDSWNVVNLFSRQLAERDTQLAERDAQLAERDAQLAECNAQLAERNAQLEEIYASRSWRLMLRLQKIRQWLIPSNSLRAAIARFPLQIWRAFVKRLRQ